MQISVPVDKLKGLGKDILAIWKDKGGSLRSLSKVIGKMNSFSRAVLPGHLHFRSLERFLQDQFRLHD
jgi:hypothetical protein